jgi:hypothetical protein
MMVVQPILQRSIEIVRLVAFLFLNTKTRALPLPIRCTKDVSLK